MEEPLNLPLGTHAYGPKVGLFIADLHWRNKLSFLLGDQGEKINSWRPTIDLLNEGQEGPQWSSSPTCQCATVKGGPDKRRLAARGSQLNKPFSTKSLGLSAT